MTDTELKAGLALIDAMADVLDRIVDHVAVPEEEEPVIYEARKALDEGRRVFGDRA